MSHAAIVAFQVGPDAYDIHYSHNGAQDLQLASVLRDHADNFDVAREEGLGEIEQVPQMEKWESFEAADSEINIESKSTNEAIDRQPRAEGIPADAIGLGLNFADVEAVYVVRNGRVETYFPVWLYPDVIRPWRDSLVVEVYKSGKIPSSPVKMHEKIEASEPLRVIDEETFSGNYVEDTIVERVVREQHANIYALCEKSEDELAEYDEEELKGGMVLHTDSYVLTVELTGDFDDLPDGIGRGMLVEIGQRSQRQLELAGAAIRFEAGGRLNAIDEPTEQDIAESSAEAAIEAYRQFGDTIAPFSPPPYGQIYEALAQLDGVSSGAKSKLAKYLRQN